MSLPLIIALTEFWSGNKKEGSEPGVHGDVVNLRWLNPWIATFERLLTERETPGGHFQKLYVELREDG